MTKLQIRLCKSKQYHIKMKFIRLFEKPQYAREQQIKEGGGNENISMGCGCI